MVAGIFFIIAGLLILAYPQLLVLAVAALLISVGLIITTISYRFKKMNRHFSDPFADFFVRF